jgi:hypothetical protein
MNVITLLLALSAPPQAPPVQAPAAADPYFAFRARVEAGAALTAYVGVPKPAGWEGVQLETAVLPRGVWKAWREPGGRVVVQEHAFTYAAPAVAAPVPFAPPPGPQPGGFTPGIPARSAVGPSTSSPVPARGPAPIPTPALRVIRGGTDPGCLSG